MTHVSARSCIWFVTCSVKMSHDKVPIFVAEAVHRYYESRRRLFNDDQPARREIAKEVKGRSKKRNLQKKVQYIGWTILNFQTLSSFYIPVVMSAFYYSQLYNTRKNHLRNPKQAERWASIDYRYMTEESEGEEDKIHQHVLPWRSQGLPIPLL